MNTAQQKKFVVCAGCIIYRNILTQPEILLIQPREHPVEWGIPKGHMDETDASIKECAIRETYEETGLICFPTVELTPVYTSNPREIKRVHAFLAKQLGHHRPEPITTEEVFDIRWFDINALPQIHRYQINMLAEAKTLLRYIPLM
jgi:8-oxo-dGTP pyrophosphatase MutT (NUDIX family)